MSSTGSAISVRQGQLEVFFAKHGNLIWKLFVGFFVLYILMPPLLLVAVSFEPSGIVRVNTGFSLRWYDKMINSRGLMDALFKSILLAFLTTAVTTVLALQAALGYRKARFKTLIIAIMILPIFLPGIIQGFSLSLLLTEFLGLQRSLWTELVGHVLWALPFAFLVILTSMSVVKRETVLAAMDLGANEWRAFRDIEAQGPRARGHRGGGEGMSRFEDLHFPDAPRIVVEPPGPKTLALLGLQEKYESAAVLYPKSLPLAIDEGRGSTVKDVDGNLFLDFYAGISVLNLGHSNPAITKAAEGQLRRLTHSLDFPHEARLQLARVF